MVSLAKIKFIKNLKLKKNRKLHGFFVAEGPKILKDILASDYEITELYALHSFIKTYRDVLIRKKIHCVEISEKELLMMSHLATPNEVLAVVKMKEVRTNITELSNKWSILLQNINDPGNLGTIVRMAHWLNIENIFCSNDSVDIYNPKSIQSSMGSFAYVNVFPVEMPLFLAQIHGLIPVFGAFMQGTSIYNMSFPKAGILLMGSESHGIDKLFDSFITQAITIPRTNPNTGPDSLNVAMATCIIGAELLRQDVLKSI